MALSNWDTFAINQDSEPIAGQVSDCSGVGVQIYKNFLYISDPVTKAAVDDGHHRYSGDIVMQIQEGLVRYGNWGIYAERGPKNGVYVVAESHRLEKIANDGRGTYEVCDQVILVGCGVYGYIDEFELYREELEAVKVSVEELTERDDIWIAYAGDEVVFEYVTDDGPKEIWAGPRKDPVFLGVEEAEIEYLREVMVRADRVLHFPHQGTQLDEIDLEKGLRFNPGDAFFARALGQEETGTPVGDARPPAIEAMIAVREQQETAEDLPDPDEEEEDG